MNTQPYANRYQRLQDLLRDSELDALVLNPGPDLSYLTGLDFHLMERPVVALFLPDQQPVLILPELESGALDQAPYPVQDIPYSEDRDTWDQAFRRGIEQASLEKAALGIIPRRLRVLELRYLENAAPGADFTSAQNLVSRLRMIKDEDEIQALEEAVRIAQCALGPTLSSLEPGVTEKDVSSKLVSWLLQHGSDPQLPFFPIVSFGSNTAQPHAAPTDRPLQEGDLILIDWGASVGGYASDITRTFSFGDLNPELEKVGDFVRQANAAARQAVRPGASPTQVDRAARSVIAEAGYGKFFTHRTGHGLGREAHEEPYINEGEHQPLEPGMTFTVEPGIYLPGRGGVRIEDDILVTEEGARSLSTLPREILRLDDDDPYQVARC